MQLDRIWPPDARIIEIDAPNGALGQSIRGAGFAKHLIVVVFESRARAIAKMHPALASGIVVTKAPRVIRQNNADVLILHGWSALRCWQWRNVRHARYVVLPWTGWPLCWFAALIWLCQWALGRFARPQFVSSKRVDEDRRGRKVFEHRLVVCRNRRPRPQQGARRYIPHALGIEGFLRAVEATGIRHSVLRWFEDLPQLPAGEDIDLLVDDAGLETVHSMLDAGLGIQPVDVYSVTGLPGADYRSMPYFPPYLAEELLDRAVCHRELCHVPAPHEHFLSLAYHALYHKGAGAGIPTRAGDRRRFRSDHDYALVLGRLARQLGIDVSVTLEDLDGYLDTQGWRPPHDMLVRLARHNRWVRWLVRRPEKASAADDRLAVFLIREEALRRGGIERAALLVESFGFTVLARHRIESRELAVVARSIRGGNWGRGPWPTSGGPPVAAIVAYDPGPIAPTRRQRRRFPFVANARLFCKEQLRDAFNDGEPPDQHCNVVHSSDNGREAIDYLRIIMPEAIDGVLSAARSSTGEFRRAA
jgi:hypothetical protein